MTNFNNCIPSELLESAQRSRKDAVRAFCLGCMGGSARDVRDCESTRCPLWRYRRGSPSRGS